MDIPKVGVGVIILKDGETRRDKKVLLGKRKGSHGAGTWSFPGGHLEYQESLKQCAVREVMEETGIRIMMLDEFPMAVTNDIFRKENKHYITLYLRAKYLNGNPELREPNRCDEWKWYDWQRLPSNLFLPVRNLIKQGFFNPVQ